MHIVYGFIGAFLFGSAYLAVRQVRTFADWAHRRPGPQERVEVFLPLAAIVGFVAGITAYQPVQLGIACHQANQPVLSCWLANSLQPGQTR